jgi:hypothetical protein
MLSVCYMYPWKNIFSAPIDAFLCHASTLAVPSNSCLISCSINTAKDDWRWGPAHYLQLPHETIKAYPHISFLLCLTSIIWKRYLQPRRNKKLRCSKPWTSSMPAIWLTLYDCIRMYIWISKYMLTIYRLPRPWHVYLVRANLTKIITDRAQGRTFATSTTIYIGRIRKRDIWPRSCSGLARLKFCSSSIRENPRPLLFNLPFSSSSHGKGKLIEVM